MENNFLINFSNIPFKNNNTKNINISTLPDYECINGIPINKYSGYGINSCEVLYSIWNSFQSTLGAKYTLNQCKKGLNGINKECIGPANIYFIRHGEKNKDFPNYSLNENGIYRASNLVTYINTLAKEGFPISYIITCNPCSYITEDPSMRPQQTISMVSFLLNIPFFIYGNAGDVNLVSENLFNIDNPIFNGLNVLICWEHSCIQSLCLNILDTAATLKRLPNDIPTADKFFDYINYTNSICPGGNYICKKDSNNYNEYFEAPDNIYYSQTYPYWNNYNFNHIYVLSSNKRFIFNEFKIDKQPCLTCYSNCELKIGLYQPININKCVSSEKYYNSNDDKEDECIGPCDWLFPLYKQ